MSPITAALAAQAAVRGLAVQGLAEQASVAGAALVAGVPWMLASVLALALQLVLASGLG